MKKIIATATVLACAASMASAQVTSANIVGYAKKSLSSGALIIVSPQFRAGSTNGIALGDAFSGLTDASRVYSWTGSGYGVYEFYNGEGLGWFDVNNAYAPANDVIVTQGAGVWLADGSGGSSPIMAGEVPSVASVTNTLAAAINLVANPYPVAFQLGDIDTTSLSDADRIYAYNGSTYDVYEFYNGEGLGWFDVNNAYAPANAETIDVGQGFWLDCAAGGSIIWNKNY